jgi:3-methylcrotonyl-CoA carboxylase alpha subunit
MRKVLIANRGEIACRVIRSCKSLGLATVAVYSDADAGALHVATADEAVRVGPAAARESYLDIGAILAAARASGTDAIHPGYGFLSENATFAEAVGNAGLAWIGPAPQTIAAMGDKERARALAAAAGVPTLPGSARFAPENLAGLAEAAAQTGFPLLVKAAAGGGGIGMRRVEHAGELAGAVAATQAMATRSFGDGTVYLERFVRFISSSATVRSSAGSRRSSRRVRLPASPRKRGDECSMPPSHCAGAKTIAVLARSSSSSMQRPRSSFFWR